MLARRDRLVRSHVRTRFLVTLKTGEAFDGLLDEVDASTLILVAAWAVDAKGNRVPVDGRLFVDRSNVAYMQVPGAANAVIEA